MKYYEIVDVNVKTGEEWTEWEGSNFDEAIKEKEKSLAKFNYLTDKEKSERAIECRAYNLPDDVDVTDKDAIIEAKCDIASYDEF